MTSSSKAISPADRWADPDAGERYAEFRFRSPRARDRDPHHLGQLLARHLAPPAQGTQALVLDAPSGSARLRDMIERAGHRWVGLDVSASMLLAGKERGAERLLRGSLFHLPLADRSVGAVVSCRFLHHMPDEKSFCRAVTELVRVADELVVATFWSRATLSEFLPRPQRRRPRGRIARDESFVRQAFAQAGAPVIEMRHSCRFLSRQTYLAAKRSSEAPLP